MNPLATFKHRFAMEFLAPVPQHIHWQNPQSTSRRGAVAEGPRWIAKSIGTKTEFLEYGLTVNVSSAHFPILKHAISVVFLTSNRPFAKAGWFQVFPSIAEKRETSTWLSGVALTKTTSPDSVKMMRCPLASSN